MKKWKMKNLSRRKSNAVEKSKFQPLFWWNRLSVGNVSNWNFLSHRLSGCPAGLLYLKTALNASNLPSDINRRAIVYLVKDNPKRSWNRNLRRWASAEKRRFQLFGLDRGTSFSWGSGFCSYRCFPWVFRNAAIYGAALPKVMRRRSGKT